MFGKSVFFLAAAVFGVFLWGCAHGGSVGTPGGADATAYTLTLPHAPARHEAVWLRVVAGKLPPGARLIVRTSDREIVGSVAPFGVRPGQEAGVYTIPLPESAVANGKLSLSIELEDRAARAVRAPTPQEVKELSLVLVPVSGNQ